jgi:transglutaminase/protease-like cytokinesis protein 3
MPEIAERSTDIGIAQSTVRNGALSDRCTEQAATLDEKLNVATAVNHSLTEYAQFVNQSESLSIGPAQYRVSSPKRRTRSNHPTPPTGSGLACGEHAERLSSEYHESQIIWAR